MSTYDEVFPFYTLMPQGYYIQPTREGEGEFEHRLFGPHNIKGADCPNCNKPLLHLLTIDTNDPRVGLMDHPIVRIPFLFCWTCMIATDRFYYQLLADNEIRIISYEEGEDGSPEDWIDFPIAYPGAPVRLDPLGEEQQWFNQRMNRYNDEHPEENEDEDAFVRRYLHLTHIHHQLGGEPMFKLNPWGPTPCPICRRTIPFLAVLDDETLSGQPISDPNTFVESVSDYDEVTKKRLIRSVYQFFMDYCPDCRVVSTYVIGD